MNVRHRKLCQVNLFAKQLVLLTCACFNKTRGNGLYIRKAWPFFNKCRARSISRQSKRKCHTFKWMFLIRAQPHRRSQYLKSWCAFLNILKKRSRWRQVIGMSGNSAHFHIPVHFLLYCNNFPTLPQLFHIFPETFNWLHKICPPLKLNLFVD